MLRVVFVLLALLVAAAGCGGDDAPSSVDTATEAVDAPQAEAGDAIVATDSGSSFTLPQGGETSLRLSSEYLWEDPVVEGGAVELSPVDYLQDPGFREWLVQGVAPGTATISSLGTPACDGEHGCPDEPARFRVTITVGE